VTYSLHEIQLHRSDVSKWATELPQMPPEDIDARILQALEAELWSLIQTIAEFLKIPASTVHLHLTTSLNMKNQHFKCVPHFLDDDLRATQLEGDRQLLDVLQAHERCHFRDLITGDKTWIYFDMKPGTIWLPADAELPVCVKRTIASEKLILIISWGIHGIAHYCWPHKDHIRFTILLWRRACIRDTDSYGTKPVKSGRYRAEARYQWISHQHCT
jgi:hypothetical protein